MTGKPGSEEKIWFETYMFREQKELEKRDDENSEVDADTASDISRRRQAMLNILDHLRLGKDLQSDIERKLHDDLQVGDKRLKTVLCDPADENNKYIPREPLLVVIHVPESEKSLLRKEEEGKHGIMLLDMPGLDSGNMSKNTSCLYRDLLWESDMIIFLQSSVTPLNEKGISTFKEVVGQRDDLTAWIVHNKMITKPWLREDIVNAENNNQIDRTKEYLEQILIASPSRREVDPIQVNLGTAHDCRFRDQSDLNKDPETLFEQSKFKHFQEKIRENVNVRGAEVRDQHCRENLTNAIEKKLNNIAKKRRKTIDRIEYLEKLNNKLTEVSNQFSGWIQENDSPVNVLKFERVKGKEWNKEALEKSFKIVYNAEYRHYLEPTHIQSRLLSEVDNKFDEFGKSCAEKANEFLKKLDIWNSVRWRINESTNISMKEIIKGIYDSLFEEKISPNDMKNYVPPLPEVKKNLMDIKGWHLLEATVEHARLFEEPKDLLKKICSKFFKEKKYDWEPKTINDIRDDTYISGYVARAEQLINDMDDAIRDELTETAIETLKDILEKSKNKVTRDKEDAEDNKAKIDAHIEQLNSIKDKI